MTLHYTTPVVGMLALGAARNRDNPEAKLQLNILHYTT